MISAMLMTAASILIAAIGGMICKKSGVVNIALEGFMVIGAVTAAITHIFLESSNLWLGEVLSIPFALFFASIAGGMLSVLYAAASVTFKANQVISGVGINLFSGGLAVFICQIIFRMDRTPKSKTGMMPDWFGIYPVIWIALVILALAWLMLYKSPWGVRLRTAGENLQDTVSVNADVNKLRYTAIIISGLLAGLAGACLVLTQDNQFSMNTVNGKGYIAFALVSFGLSSRLNGLDR
jgi:simple sugar transport system permease protein